ncbi:hypothetical protein L0F63_005457 [Massospora cicadina]|nr:hypothetical protein L0F63_005457 [Massospora cicadina]
MQRGRTLWHGKTLTRLERYQPQEPMLSGDAEREKLDGAILKWCGFPNDDVIQAWREKISLCFIISLICAVVVFLTLGLPYAFCPDSVRQNIRFSLMSIGPADGGEFAAKGYYVINEGVYAGTIPQPSRQFSHLFPDISSYFKRNPQDMAACSSLTLPSGVSLKAVTFDTCSNDNGNQGCPFEPIEVSAPQFNIQLQTKDDQAQIAGYGWAQVIPGFTTYLNANPTPIPGDPLDAVIRATASRGSCDATRLFHRDVRLLATIPCLTQKYGAGRLAKSAVGCFGVDFFMALSLVVILGIIAIRFAMAFIFHWFISDQLAKWPKGKAKAVARSVAVKEVPWMVTGGQTVSDDSHELFTVLLVTCYSEGELDDKKLLFIVADGIITGSGNDMSTPNICLSMLEVDPAFDDPEPQSYIAVAAGHKRHNRAKVYPGHFIYKDHRVPTLVIIKCGNAVEEGKPKAGNCGKHDSQLILMNFFSRIQHLMGVTADHFEMVLMVDADTKVYPDSLKLLTYCLINDPLIMGLCGETKIANKRDSWVMGIQVFEYYISHHLGKGFESMFGGVTCLPGCFCMYRLKAPKGDGEWVPIITKLEIIQEYLQYIVETLHQKNLLLLGEDRFLTTLMLRNFPNLCKTVVPDQFAVLLSQRWRWINSTIHNLLELMLVHNLCSTFCFSMQFVIFMELIGTVITSLSSALPLVMLIAVLFTPTLLITITSQKLIYVAWMGIYLLALPVWNFVLPIYSYWHFDDFLWGPHTWWRDGDFDASKVSLHRWEDYERRRRRFDKCHNRSNSNLDSESQRPKQSNLSYGDMFSPSSDFATINCTDMPTSTPSPFPQLITPLTCQPRLSPIEPQPTDGAPPLPVTFPRLSYLKADVYHIPSDFKS